MRKPVVFISLVFTLLISSCNQFSQLRSNQPAPVAVQPDLVHASTTPASHPMTNIPTATIAPTNSPEPTIPTQPTRQPVIVATQLDLSSTSTPVPKLISSAPCDQIGYVTDVTIPDGAAIASGASFTKTWEIINTGSCTWDSSYALIFANQGKSMTEITSQQLTNGSVAPGQKIQISVEMKAPVKLGTYRGYWKLRNGAGLEFGIGTYDTAFWVEINVVNQSYNFVTKHCSAIWEGSTTTKDLNCNGNSSDSNGFVKKLDHTVFEGHKDDEPGLWINPPLSSYSETRGTYPAILITSGSRFKTYLGCKAGASNCSVRFRVDYKANGGSELVLGEWYADVNTYIEVDLDLESLAGKSVQFILIVNSNGASDQDEALWLQPRIAEANSSTSP